MERAGGGGKLRTDAEEERRRATGEHGRVLHTDAWERTEDERKLARALEVVAKQVGAKHISAVAIAYVMQKTPYVFPIVGGRKVEHLEANLEALDIALEDEHIKYLESILPFDFGFPYSAFVSCLLSLFIYFVDGGLMHGWCDRVIGRRTMLCTNRRATSTNGLSSRPFAPRSNDWLLMARVPECGKV